MPYLQVNGIRLYYEWQGRADGPLLLLVNGLLTDTSSWAPVIRDLGPYYRILAYDCRGQGQSDKPDHPYPPTLHAQDLEELLTGLGLVGGVGSACIAAEGATGQGLHAIGLSSGGCVALQLAVRHPEWFRSLTLVDAYAEADTMLKVKLQGWVAAMEAGGGPLRFDVATPWVWGRSFLNRSYEALRPFRDKAMGISQQPAINLIRGAMDYSVAGELGRITCPTLAVVGEEDLLTPLPYAEQIVRGIPGARLAVLGGAGHASLLEQPAEFNRLALAFLDEAAGQPQR
ncbi:MAG: alpha/beta fold hydrolase [Symbiobacteriia bacterium]